MSDARSVRNFGLIRQQVGATVAPYELWQTASGKAGVYDNATAAASGDYKELTTAGEFRVVKASGFVALHGGRAYWDHSANAISYKKVNDRDFYAGRFSEDAGSSDTECVIDLNADPPYDLDLINGPTIMNFPVGTQALGNVTLNGFGWPLRKGGSLHLFTTATNEAQRVDVITVDGFVASTSAANAIIEFAFRVINDGAGSAADFSLGIANASHASDADSIAEHLLIHLDANATAIKLQSKDGTTTVAATDTTTTYTEGSTVACRKEVWFDCRDAGDVQCYVDGVLVLSSTVFDIDAATGPWFLLGHLEKSSSTDVYEAAIDWGRARFSEQ